MPDIYRFLKFMHNFYKDPTKFNCIAILQN